jgi:hypothetical protein
VLAQNLYYDLGTNHNPVLGMTVSRNSSTTKCRWYVTIEKGSFNDGSYNRFLSNGIAKIGLQIYNQNGTQILKDLPDAIYPNNVLSGEFPTNGGANSQTQSYQFVLAPVPYSQMTGFYQNTWQIHLYVAHGNSNQFHLTDSSTIGAYYSVFPSVDLSLTDVGEGFNRWDTTQNLNFGNIQQNEQMSFHLQIGANQPYKFTVSSSFGGKMRRSGGGSAASDNINYQMTIAGTNYSSQKVITQYPYTTETIHPPSGTVVIYPITVKILDDPVTKAAGAYNDVVTFSVIAQ